MEEQVNVGIDQSWHQRYITQVDDFRLCRMGDFRSHLGNSFSLNQHFTGTDDASVLHVKQSCRVQHDSLRLCLRVNQNRHEHAEDQSYTELTSCHSAGMLT